MKSKDPMSAAAAALRQMHAPKPGARARIRRQLLRSIETGVVSDSVLRVDVAMTERALLPRGPGSGASLGVVIAAASAMTIGVAYWVGSGFSNAMSQPATDVVSAARVTSVVSNQEGVADAVVVDAKGQLAPVGMGSAVHVEPVDPAPVAIARAVQRDVAPARATASTSKTKFKRRSVGVSPMTAPVVVVPSADALAAAGSTEGDASEQSAGVPSASSGLQQNVIDSPSQAATPSRSTPSASAPVASESKPAALDPGRHLSEELVLIRGASQALRASDPKAALLALREHAQRFPNGALTPERKGLRVLALCALAPSASSALAERADFLRTANASPLFERVNRACATPTDQRSP